MSVPGERRVRLFSPRSTDKPCTDDLRVYGICQHENQSIDTDDLQRVAMSLLDLASAMFCE